MNEVNGLISDLCCEMVISASSQTYFLLINSWAWAVYAHTCSSVQLKLVIHSFCKLFRVSSDIPVIKLMFELACAAASSAAGRVVLLTRSSMCGTREERFTVKGFTAGILAALVSDSSLSRR